jgi:hypothetical protein
VESTVSDRNVVGIVNEVEFAISCNLEINDCFFRAVADVANELIASGDVAGSGKHEDLDN